jgi:hypothetical protein
MGEMLQPTEVRAVSAEFLDAGGVVGVFEADFEIEEVSKPEFVELARLFHAAPAMYEALRELVDSIPISQKEGRPDYICMVSADKTLRAREAMAKAKGEVNKDA